MLLPANQMCEPVASNPEDGITPEIKFLLALRKQGSRIDTWEGLWRVLFPHDDKIPSSDFEHPVEHFELRAFIEEKLPRVLAAEFQMEPGITMTEGELQDKFRRVTKGLLESFHGVSERSEHDTGS
ncbi:hypothetical protein VTI28DRAFT_5035 [Corynascus sepedonium]